MAKALDISGQKFGSLTAIERCGTCASRDIKWRFICDCGNEFEANGYYARSGKITTCPECARERTRTASVKHGLTNSPEFLTWTDIQTRCHNPNSTSYERYGGRGIKVCEKWRNSFQAFLDDMGKRPTCDHSIDRIDNDKGYEPGNCRWATRIEQANNKRNNRLVTIGGETKTIAQWAHEHNLNAATVWRRVNEGKSGEDLLAKPWRGSRKNGRTGTLTHNGITDTMAGWSRRTGIKYSTLAMRLIRYGWPLDKALEQEEKKCA